MSMDHWCDAWQRMTELQSLYRPWVFQEVEGSIFQNNRHVKVLRLSALSSCRLYPPVNIPGTHFSYRLSRPECHNTARRIMLMKSCNDTIGKINEMFQVSTAKYMRTAFFWVITQRVVVMPYRCFGTTCRSLHGSGIQKEWGGTG